MAETFVQLSPDSTGKKVRNLTAQVVQPDGSVSSVVMQVVSIADESGNPISYADQQEWQSLVLLELRAIRMCQQATYDNGITPKDQEDFYELAKASLNTCPGE